MSDPTKKAKLMPPKDIQRASLLASMMAPATTQQAHGMNYKYLLMYVIVDNNELNILIMILFLWVPISEPVVAYSGTERSASDGPRSTAEEMVSAPARNRSADEEMAFIDATCAES
jgi:hypothetical protein